MRSQEPTYKNFPFPVRILLSYIILSALGIVLLDMVAMFLIVTDSVNNFFERLLSIGLMLVAIIIISFIFTIILHFLCGKKIYRGIGLYRFMMITSIIALIAFIGIIVYMNSKNIDYTIFNFFTLFFECVFPLVLMLLIRLLTRRCDWCGLINTYKVTAVKVDDLGNEHKFHTEGGYYREQKITGKISERTSVAPNVMDVQMTTTQYVPKTTVYDGLFKKKRTTTGYKCAVCENVIEETYITETKIGG